jgi:hypothetical protein
MEASDMVENLMEENGCENDENGDDHDHDDDEEDEDDGGMEHNGIRSFFKDHPDHD